MCAIYMCNNLLPKWYILLRIIKLHVYRCTGVGPMRTRIHELDQTIRLFDCICSDLAEQLTIIYTTGNNGHIT